MQQVCKTSHKEGLECGCNFNRGESLSEISYYFMVAYKVIIIANSFALQVQLQDHLHDSENGLQRAKEHRRCQLITS